MKIKKLKSTKILLKLVNYLLSTLDDLTSIENVSDFTEGEIIAFVECLEIISGWERFHTLKIGDIERKYPVK